MASVKVTVAALAPIVMVGLVAILYVVFLTHTQLALIRVSAERDVYAQVSRHLTAVLSQTRALAAGLREERDLRPQVIYAPRVKRVPPPAPRVVPIFSADSRLRASAGKR